MIKVVSVDAMRNIEASANKSVMSYDDMMEKAGKAGAEVAKRMIADLEQARVTILVGGGNNGGDGLVTARYLAQETDAEVRLYMLKRRDESDKNYSAVLELFMVYAEDDHDNRLIRQMVASADLVIDALFGIGVRLPIKGDADQILRNANQAINQRRSDKPKTTLIDPTQASEKYPRLPRVLAIDCPSGLNCDTGEIDSNAIQSDETITFISAKKGLFEFPGAGQIGHLTVAPIGIPEELPELAREKTFLVDADYVGQKLPSRSSNSHKGTYGKALIFAGCTNYVGAPALSAEGAYRSGAGLVTVATSEAVVPIVANQLTEATYLSLPNDLSHPSDNQKTEIANMIKNRSSLLVGPGWGQENGRAYFLDWLLSMKDDLPSLVIDADGLNLLAKMENWWKKLPNRTIITPHLGEMSRLSGISISDIQTNRLHIAQEKAQDWGVVLVLKGAYTIIANPKGKIAILPFNVDALATAGTGDILAGLIAGFLAQGVTPFESSIIAGYVHGYAGKLAQQIHGSGRGIIAGDILRLIPDVLGQYVRQFRK